MKTKLLTMTALSAMMLIGPALQGGADAASNMRINRPPVMVKPKLKLRPPVIHPRVRVKVNTSRLANTSPNKRAGSDIAEGGPQPEPPTRPRTARVTPTVEFIAPLPRSKPAIQVAIIDQDDLKTIPADLWDNNSEALKDLEKLRDMLTNGPNNAAPDVFGSRGDGRPDNGADNPLDRATDQAETNQENRDKQLDHFRAIAGFDPANPGGRDTRQGREFHTPAKNPGAAGGGIKDPRGMASGGRVIWSGGNQRGDTYNQYTQYEDFTEVTTQYTPNPPRDSGIAAKTVRETRNPDGSTRRTTNIRYKDWTRQVTDEWRDSDGQVTHTREREYNDEGEQDYDSGIHETDSQPGAEGSGPGGADNCGWNPMSGCTKRSVKIWDAMVQPGARQDSGSAARPSLGQEAVTNTGDSTFDSGASGGSGGGGQPDPCRMAGNCGGPIGDGGSGPARAS